MPGDAPPIAYVLHLNKSRDGRWIGRLVDAETQASIAFTNWENLIEELMRHGIQLDTRTPKEGETPLTLYLRRDVGGQI